MCDTERTVAAHLFKVRSESQTDSATSAWSRASIQEQTMSQVQPKEQDAAQKTMPQTHHQKASEHHEQASKHHKEAAKLLDTGDHKTAAHHALTAVAHSAQA